MILYPTETIYALGVNALDKTAVRNLFSVKGRVENKSMSWLVRNIADIEHYSQLSPLAKQIAERFLPGPLTLILPARDLVPTQLRGPDDTISFRISTDKIAQKLIQEFMSEHKAPLTCTSANLSGEPTLPTVPEILAQLGSKASLIDKIIDNGPRSGTASTVIKVVDDTVEIIREGATSVDEILSFIKSKKEFA
jgi:L-threonylcarbamoyladenylate synthase